MGDMAKPSSEEKKKFKGTEPVVQVPAEAEEKIRFLVWFSVELEKFVGLKAHHMHAVEAFFRDLGIPDPATPAQYEDGMLKFGFGRKK